MSVNSLGVTNPFEKPIKARNDLPRKININTYTYIVCMNVVHKLSFGTLKGEKLFLCFNFYFFDFDS